MATKKIGSVITFNGEPGTGKDAGAEGLKLVLENEEGLIYQYRSVGTDVFRALADSHGVSIEEFIQRCKTDPATDREVDAESLRMCSEGNGLIITSRTIPSLLYRTEIYAVKNPDSVLRFRLDCSNEEERIRRIVIRDYKKANGGNKPDEMQITELFDATKGRTLKRQKDDTDRYYKYYGVRNVFDDKFLTDSLDTAGMTLPEQIRQMKDMVMNYMED